MAATAVRALELATEAMVTQTQQTPVDLQILDGIRSLGQTYHQLHEDLQAGHAQIVTDIAALREERRKDWEDINRQLTGLRNLIAQNQRLTDDALDALRREVDDLQHGPITELTMRMQDVEKRLAALEARPLEENRE